MAVVQQFVTEKLTGEQADTTRRLMERILPTVQQMTKETAKRDIEWFVAEIRDESEEAKMLALLSRVEGLSPPSSGDEVHEANDGRYPEGRAWQIGTMGRDG
ncbi:hypothetical protein DL767_001112 [Monosporascus sp. MG133]|nr:hypothetical protein DL767_001112 [Monosporascus sp. MG133]